MNEHQAKVYRDLHEIDLARRELEANKAKATKRYNAGIKMLDREKLSVESSLHDEPMEGMTPIETRSEELRTLIADPSLRNIPEDTDV